MIDPIDSLRTRIRERLFASDREEVTPGRVGMEAELVPVDASSGSRVAPDDPEQGTGALLAGIAHEQGWRRSTCPTGAPAYTLPSGGVVSFEPGGQIEISSPVHTSVRALAGEMGAVAALLTAAAERTGVRLLGVGIDPTNPVETAELVLDSERYVRMADHLDGFGPSGRRMMRQTAALHVNLDLGPDPIGRFDLANRLAPLLIAIFANSSRYAGGPIGHRSYRAHQWRVLDPARTGLAAGPDPVEAYLEMALRAPVLFLGARGEVRRPLREWMADGPVSQEMVDRHLSTLFPEVRARGYLEFRGIDALPPCWYSAPLVYLTGILYDEESSRRAAELLPDVCEAALVRAGRTGLADPGFLELCRETWKLALEGADRLGDFVGVEAGDSAREFYERFTSAGRDPGVEAGRSDRRDVDALAAEADQGSVGDPLPVPFAQGL